MKGKNTNPIFSPSSFLVDLTLTFLSSSCEVVPGISIDVVVVVVEEEEEERPVVVVVLLRLRMFLLKLLLLLLLRGIYKDSKMTKRKGIPCCYQEVGFFCRLFLLVLIFSFCFENERNPK